jgi:hypothetical protein
MSFKLVYSITGSLHGESSGTLHTTNHTRAAFKIKDYMVNKSRNLKFIYKTRKVAPKFAIYFLFCSRKEVR